MICGHGRLAAAESSPCTFYAKGDVGMHDDAMGSGSLPLRDLVPGRRAATGGHRGPIRHDASVRRRCAFSAPVIFQHGRMAARDLREMPVGAAPVDRPARQASAGWDALASVEHVGLMDHLGAKQFMVLGFGIGEPSDREPARAGGQSQASSPPC